MRLPGISREEKLVATVNSQFELTVGLFTSNQPRTRKSASPKGMNVNSRGRNPRNSGDPKMVPPTPKGSNPSVDGLNPFGVHQEVFASPVLRGLRPRLFKFDASGVPPRTRVFVILSPFACHPERSEGSRYFAQGKLREESRQFERSHTSPRADSHGQFAI